MTKQERELMKLALDEHRKKLDAMVEDCVQQLIQYDKEEDGIHKQIRWVNPKVQVKYHGTVRYK